MESIQTMRTIMFYRYPKYQRLATPGSSGHSFMILMDNNSIIESF